jgi:hypothetical protein
MKYADDSQYETFGMNGYAHYPLDPIDSFWENLGSHLELARITSTYSDDSPLYYYHSYIRDLIVNRVFFTVEISLDASVHRGSYYIQCGNNIEKWEMTFSYDSNLVYRIKIPDKKQRIYYMLKWVR